MYSIMVPDLVLKAILSNKKSVSEIVKYCQNTSVHTCHSSYNLDSGEKIIKKTVAKRIFKLSGYRVDKDFDYSSLFHEMLKILVKYRTAESSRDNLSLEDENYEGFLKFGPSDEKTLADKGSEQLYAFLLHNGTVLRKQNYNGIKKSAIYQKKSSISPKNKVSFFLNT